MMNNDNKVDIRPSLGDILNGYQRESYRPETAIAEFVDNSTASYYQNKKDIEKIFPNYKLIIKIKYNQVKKNLIIEDNAWGMDIETFKDALTIGKKPKIQGGRNEYGMGLKKAASWFGKNWSVKTKSYGLVSSYLSEIDIEELVLTKSNEVTVTEVPEDYDEHYTIVSIDKLCRNITPSSIEKLKKDLSSIYRQDIKNDKIQIYVNEEKLSFEEPDILEEIIDGIKKVWKKEITGTINLDNQILEFHGFVALRDQGSRKETGFALLRRGRVIIGGYDKNYKPRNIFKNDNDFVSLRLFGELNLDNFPVTQAKDNFDWELNGLEEIFQEKLEELCRDYIKQANNYRVKKEKEKTHVDAQQVKEIADSTVRDIMHLSDLGIKVDNKVEIETHTQIDKSEISSYNMHMKIFDEDYNVSVSFNNDENEKLIDVKQQANNIDIIFNTNFPYFCEVNTDINFIKMIQKYLILFIMSEIISERTCTDNDGLIKPYVIRETLNSILEDIIEGGNEVIYE